MNVLNGIEKTISDNVMSVEEIISYIKGNIPYDLDDIKKIVLVRNYLNLNEVRELFPNAEVVDTSRRKLFFDKETKCFIIPTNEGLVKGSQYRIQVKMLNSIRKSNIQFQEIVLRRGGDLWDQWLIRLKHNLKINSVHNLDGIIVGSINNTYFRLCKHFNHHIIGNLDVYYKSLLQNSEFFDYLNYRLDLILMEEDLVTADRCFNQDIFVDMQLKPLPSKFDISLVISERKKVDNHSQRIKELLKNDILTSYIKADYIYSKDRLNNTHNFDAAFNSSDFIIIRDPLIDYQIIKIKDSSLINFNWVSSDQISAAIKIMNINFKINNFYHFGKCGYLGKECNVGDLVRPIASKRYPDSGKETFFENLINIGIATKTLSVDSPLLETKNKLIIEADKNCYTSIEMELWSILSVLNTEQKKYISYYISDMPLSKIKLSTRLDSLVPRLKTLEVIFDQIVSDYIAQ